MTIFRLSIPSHSSLDCLQSAFSLKIRHVRWLRQRAWSTVSLAVTLQTKVREPANSRKILPPRNSFFCGGRSGDWKCICCSQGKRLLAVYFVTWPNNTTGHPRSTFFQNSQESITTFFLLQVIKTCLHDVCINSIDVLFRLCVAFERLNEKTADIWRRYHWFPSQMSAVFSG